MAAPPHFTTARTGTVKPAVLKGASGAMIEVHAHATGSSGYAGIAALNDNYLLAVGRRIPGVSDDARVSYLKGGVWRNLLRARTIINDESYSSGFVLADEDFLLGGTSTSDGHGVWRDNGPPRGTKVLTSSSEVESMDGSAPTNVWALDSAATAYQSTDGAGASWVSRGTVLVAGVGRKISVVDGSNVFAAVSDDVYAWGGGTSWSALGTLGMSALAIHAVSASEIWVAGYDSVNSLWKIKLWNGASWAEKWSASLASVTAIHSIKKDTNSAYVYCVGELSGASWGVVSNDTGSSWGSITWPSGYGPVTDIFVGATSAPTLRNLNPLADSGQVYTDSSIEVEIVDPTGVVESSVELDLIVGVSTYPVWASEAQQTGFSVTKSDVTGGKKYVITADSRLPSGTDIELAVTADNNDAETLDTSYEFTSAKTIFGDAYHYPKGAVCHFDGKEWQYPFYKESALDGDPRDNCFSMPTKDFFAYWDGTRVQWYRNGSWSSQPISAFTGAVNITTVWAHSAGTHIVVGGDIGSSHGRVWVVNATTGVVSIVWSAPWHYLYPRMMRGYGNLVWFCGSSGSGSNDTMYSTDGGYTWLNGGFAYGAYATVVSIFVRSDGVVYAGRYLTSSDGLAVVRNSGGGWVTLPRIPSGFSFYYAYEVFSASDNDVFAKVQCGLYDNRLYHFNGYEWDWYINLVTYTWVGLNGGAENDVRILVSNPSSWQSVEKGWDGFAATDRVRTWPTWYHGATREIDYVAVDLVPPELVNKDPVRNTVAVPVDTTIKFDLLDPDSGLDLSTVVVTVDGDTAWTGDAPAGSFSGSRAAVPFGYRYTITPGSNLPFGSDIEIHVTADDVDGNSLDETYSFSTDIRAPIWVVGENPSGNSTIGYDYVRRWNGHTWVADTLGFKGGILRGIWAYDRDNAWACGDIPPGETGGTLARWNGSVWSQIVLGTSSHNLEAVWGFAANDVWVCGRGNELWHWNGSVWSDQSSALPTSADWYGIWGSASDDIFMVGSGGKIVHYNGSAWSEQTSGTTEILRGVHGSAADDVLAVGDNNTAKHYAGSAWANANSGLAAAPRAVWLLNSSLGIAACYGEAVYQWGGSSWSVSKGGLGASYDGNGAYIRASDAQWVVGVRNGEASIEEYDGSWSVVDLDTSGGQNFGIFGTIPDSTPPVLQNQDPAPSEPNVAQDTTVYLEITDADSGVDASTVVIEINSVVAWTGDAQQTGFTVVKSVISGGFSYLITPDTEFNEGVTITVDVEAWDLAGVPNQLIDSYSFSILAANPVLQNQNPAPFDTDVPTDTNIYLEIVDPGSGVDASSVVITVEGTTAWSGDAAQPGFSVIKTPITNGYSYNIDPDSLLTEAATIDIGVTASDLAPTPNTLVTSYSFDVISNPPYIASKDPLPSTTGVDKAKDVSFDLKDVAGGSGVALGTVLIYLEGNVAYVGATDTFNGPYDGAASARTPITDGHNFVFDKNTDWDAYATIAVRVVAEDGVGNAIDESWDFQVEDYQGPLISPSSPSQSEVDVAVDTNIVVVVSDESTIDLNTLQVEVNRGEGGAFELAFEYSSVPQFKTGWNGPASSVIEVAGVYTITIDPTTDFDETVMVRVRVTALDQFGNPARL